MTESELRHAIARSLTGDELREILDAATGDVARQGNPDDLERATDWDHAAAMVRDRLAEDLAKREVRG